MVVAAAPRFRTESIDIDRLVPNPWNPNRMDDLMFQKELASLRKFGYINPIIVRETKGGEYQIIDGEHRKKGLTRLGTTGEIPVTVLNDISDAEAKQLTVVLNETRGKPDQRKLGELLNDLLGTEAKSDLLDLLPYTPPVFDQIARLAPLDWQALEDTKPDKANTWVERTYRLPADAAEVIDQAINRARASEGDLQEWQALELIAADFLTG